jgi:hypothetical protein
LTLKQIQARVRKALEIFFVRDHALLACDASERAIAARLSLYIVPLFKRYDVDPEYNRHGLDPKAVELPHECREGGKKLIVPDIVVHRRGNDDDNLLVIEMKKQNNGESRDCDRAKILAMKKELSYRYGLIIDWPVGAHAELAKLREEWL